MPQNTTSTSDQVTLAPGQQLVMVANAFSAPTTSGEVVHGVALGYETIYNPGVPGPHGWTVSNLNSRLNTSIKSIELAHTVHDGEVNDEIAYEVVSKVLREHLEKDWVNPLETQAVYGNDPSQLWESDRVAAISQQWGGADQTTFYCKPLVQSSVGVKVDYPRFQGLKREVLRSHTANAKRRGEAVVESLLQEDPASHLMDKLVGYQRFDLYLPITTTWRSDQPSIDPDTRARCEDAVRRKLRGEHPPAAGSELSLEDSKMVDLHLQRPGKSP